MKWKSKKEDKNFEKIKGITWHRVNSSSYNKSCIYFLLYIHSGDWSIEIKQKKGKKKMIETERQEKEQ